MSVRIRLQRAGRKKRPFYRIVVAEAYSNRDGKFVERALYWLQQGAQPSETVKSLLQKVGVWAQFRAPKPREETVADA